MFVVSSLFDRHILSLQARVARANSTNLVGANGHAVPLLREAIVKQESGL